MSHITYAYLRDGVVYRDESAYDADDRLGSYEIVDDGQAKQAETSSIGGKEYVSLWLWSDKEAEKGRDYGNVPLLTK